MYICASVVTPLTLSLSVLLPLAIRPERRTYYDLCTDSQREIARRTGRWEEARLPHLGPGKTRGSGASLAGATASASAGQAGVSAGHQAGASAPDTDQAGKMDQPLPTARLWWA